MSTITRRIFGLCCASLAATSFSLPASSATPQTIRLADGTTVPALGQGSWHLGQSRHPLAEEEEALRLGLSLGMTLIDTAEIYGNGKAEQLVGSVIAGQRERVFLVSKVHPSHATTEGIRSACTASLTRLGTDHLDLYLLHSRDGVKDLSKVVDTFERFRADDHIRRWGVSNFSVADMDDLLRVPSGEHCATNQVAYSLVDRRVERDLLPWCAQHRMPIMAYSPLGGHGSAALGHPAVLRVAAAHGQAPAAVALAWVMRGGNAIAIPEAGSISHVRENAAAMSLSLTHEELQQLDAAFPA
jgi:diketogulonate reductase-like aldo/keto reductase